jgi:UDP-N-acetyl-D-mannosaminuronic acid dehydrogenase
MFFRGSFSFTPVRARDYLNSVKSPIGGEEPGLEELIKKVVIEGSFHVTDDIKACVNSDAILIDVQTPVDEHNKPLYDSLKQVSEQLGPIIKKGALIIVESTVAPGTTTHIVKPILEEKLGMKVGTRAPNY